MRTDLPQQAQSAPVRTDRAAAGAGFKCRLPFSSLALTAAAVALMSFTALVPALLRGQAPATQAPAAGSGQAPIHHRKRSDPAKQLVVPLPVAAPPVTPPAPEKPKWPAFDKPVQASVVWDGHGLSIDAANSSLEQILKDISTATGTKIDSINADQRVFGVYGPGQARDVLSELLQGSGYNVIMIGDQGQGTPRQILLSVRQAGAAQPVARPNQPANNEEEDTEEQQPPQQEPGPNRPGFPPGAPPRTPQQVLQELQQRQQQMQNQPQLPQQLPVNPQN